MARPGARSKISTDAHAQILESRQNGASMAEIARIFSVNTSTITRLMPKIIKAAAENPVDNTTAESFVASFGNRLECLQAIHNEVMRTYDFEWRDAATKSYGEKFDA